MFALTRTSSLTIVINYREPTRIIICIIIAIELTFLNNNTSPL
jgi:hypothetical protein